MGRRTGSRLSAAARADPTGRVRPPCGLVCGQRAVCGCLALVRMAGSVTYRGQSGVILVCAHARSDLVCPTHDRSALILVLSATTIGLGVVKSAWGAVPRLLVVRFPRPLAEPRRAGLPAAGSPRCLPLRRGYAVAQGLGILLPR
jgi:hypothetical protein